MSTKVQSLQIAVRRLREIKDNLKPLKKEESILTSMIKSKFETGVHQVGGVAFSISERENVTIDPVSVKQEFPRKLQELFEAGVFKVDNKKFEEWAAREGWDISNLKEFSYTKVLNI